MLPMRDQELQAALDRRNAANEQTDREYNELRRALAQHWNAGLSKIQAGFSENDGQLVHAWDDPFWQSRARRESSRLCARFGELQVDLKQITDRLPRHLALPERSPCRRCWRFPGRRRC